MLNDDINQWYSSNARDLAWRRNKPDGWAIVVCEVMSQQTPVSRVEPHWIEWMRRWPTPADLAATPTAEIIRAWGRLGYPRRALRLKECAVVIRDRHNNVVPSDVEELLALPGIGDYTARAVACFAYGQRVPVVDTNVRRVYARLINGNYLAGAPAKKDLHNLASLLPKDR